MFYIRIKNLFDLNFYERVGRPPGGRSFLFAKSLATRNSNLWPNNALSGSNKMREAPRVFIFFYSYKQAFLGNH